MPVYGADKTTRLAAAANVPTSPAPVPDPLVVVTSDVYVTSKIDNAKSETSGKGKALRRAFHAGQVVRQSEIDRLKF